MLTTTTRTRPIHRPRYGKLHGAADAQALAAAARKAKPLVVICASAVDAQRLRDEIAWFAPDLRISLLPDWETLPYDNFSPHQDLISQRLETLYRLSTGDTDVVIVPASTALYRLSPPAYLAGYTFFLQQGGHFDVAKLRTQLTTAGYDHVTQVVAPGEYCVRGGLIDLFPMGGAVPYRIDLVDDEIESIRTFDVDTQRTIYKVSEVRLLPAREFPMDEAARVRFRTRFRETFDGDPTKSAIYKDISGGIPPAGIEYYLPLFFDSTGSLFDYLPAGAVLALHHDVPAAIEAFWADAQSRYMLLKGDSTRPLLSPHALFLSAEDFFVAAKNFERIDIQAPDLARDDVDALQTMPPPDVAVERRAADPLHRLKAYLAQTTERVLIVADSAGRRETMAAFFAEYGLQARLAQSFAEFLASDAALMFGVAPLIGGFVSRDGYAILSEAELYTGIARSRSAREQAKRSNLEGMLRDLSELAVGDPVVHEQHGIGRYRGLRTLDFGEGETEFLLIEYADENKLYVPVAQLHVIGRYSGGPPESAPLHKLGSDQWDKAKRKAAAQVRDTAAELLNLYAIRAARKGHKFDIKQRDLDAFAEGFGFEETGDQLAAINAVVEDMRSGKPMDRLICGDVGFGKTEVALRAAFIAVAGGKQVAVLVPTTLLAEQHFQLFSDRFADFGVRIVGLSRFQNSKEQSAALKGLADGSIDIVVGTHKLLSARTRFSRLGLVVVDEEHRFGVRQKEVLKTMRAEVDVLTLTATPIPRTLALSLEGLRELSVIATAPAKRLAIKTFVTPHSPGIIRDAVMRELKRGGQVYFLHNEVDTIETQRARLAKLLPEARIAVAHGQMHERELERVMRDFVMQRHNLLLCSTIIETGIDIPSANTILINRADKFGLAQLHQLRGRVGRSHHQAYAYLLTPPKEALSAAAKRRLEAIQMMEELGSGFYLAMHDLEIRGAGEVLGESQSGEMIQVGFNLYNDMLRAAVRDLERGIETDLSQPLEVTTEINLHTPALLPGNYCSDVNERLTLYKRLANCEDEDELQRMHEELVDRFGPLPEQAQALLDSHRLRIMSRPFGIVRLDATNEQVQLQFGKTKSGVQTRLDPARVIQLIQKHRWWKLNGPDKLRIEIASKSLKERALAVRRVLDMLGGKLN